MIHYCTFCGANQTDVLVLIAGPSRQFICDGCVELCADITKEQKEKTMCLTGEGLTERTFFHAAGKKGWGIGRTRKVWEWLEERRAEGVDIRTAEGIIAALDSLPADYVHGYEKWERPPGSAGDANARTASRANT